MATTNEWPRLIGRSRVKLGRLNKETSMNLLLLADLLVVFPSGVSSRGAESVGGGVPNTKTGGISQPTTLREWPEAATMKKSRRPHIACAAAGRVKSTAHRVGPRGVWRPASTWGGRLEKKGPRERRGSLDRPQQGATWGHLGPLRGHTHRLSPPPPARNTFSTSQARGSVAERALEVPSRQVGSSLGADGAPSLLLPNTTEPGHDD